MERDRQRGFNKQEVLDEEGAEADDDDDDDDTISRLNSPVCVSVGPCVRAWVHVRERPGVCLCVTETMRHKQQCHMRSTRHHRVNVPTVIRPSCLVTWLTREGEVRRGN